MESAIFIFSALFICGTPLLFAIVGAVSGLIGGKLSSRVLGELDPELSKDVHSKIVRKSTQGFFIGFLIGGIPMGIGMADTIMASITDLSYRWAFFVTLGIVLMGAIGTMIAGSALFTAE